MQDARPRHVLLIEGRPDLRTMLGLAIEDAGFEPHAVESVGSGLKRLAARPDTVAVILDADNDAGMQTAVTIRRTWPGMAVVVMLDGTVPPTLPTGVAFISRQSLARDVGGVLHRALRDGAEIPGQA